MIASVVQEEKPKKLEFLVEYQPREQDARVVMACAVNTLSELYRIIYRMAGAELAIGTYHHFIAHQTLPNGDVIEYNGAGEFTKAIRNAKEKEPHAPPSSTDGWKQKMEDWLGSGRLTDVNREPLLSKGGMKRKLYRVLKINEAGWRQSNEHTVS